MEETKTLYFIEQTKNIEGSYIEIDTVLVEDSKEEALQEFNQLVSEDCEKSFGYTLNEYQIKAEKSFFQKLISSWKNLPAEFYRAMKVITYQPLAEYQA
ncbi:hypothetical protein M2139_002498 [Enterococcus sp. PF1-24]|uniref:hypothetical protein n=1 Tax=unclassified Enterococcus TaxID=2608891 RepID=UPI00247311CB|nr:MULTISPECIES: hypothetical protein [unclassified Enterococcus]MDH6365493.1 hypothetical protein [Enterococcus sp. PFB1-1]MDH6402594.1 hypothetical protein [Enterococcus sp. PF1-24]